MSEMLSPVIVSGVVLCGFLCWKCQLLIHWINTINVAYVGCCAWWARQKVYSSCWVCTKWLVAYILSKPNFWTFSLRSFRGCQDNPSLTLCPWRCVPDDVSLTMCPWRCVPDVVSLTMFTWSSVSWPMCPDPDHRPLRCYDACSAPYISATFGAACFFPSLRTFSIYSPGLF